jgi:hypothetical protein
LLRFLGTLSKVKVTMRRLWFTIVGQVLQHAVEALDKGAGAAVATAVGLGGALAGECWNPVPLAEWRGRQAFRARPSLQNNIFKKSKSDLNLRNSS